MFFRGNLVDIVFDLHAMGALGVLGSLPSKDWVRYQSLDFPASHPRKFYAESACNGGRWAFLR
ncbi:MAG: hypothetical protein B7Y07_02540 [Halothiobacillus sp. 24-54-40]|nr:MAG: hypothetical protein B7X12_05300 [Halothiobacillus sp. 20-53-49]OYY41404.1 MAG: hypothetical protein B7Y58_02935 [Halothiobacillus sp. 35-54-62]OYY56499.1 MAG: hypothetical protein B7Y53_01640 [Halothiobacillus sp. 28-55-5]OYZ87858.1 MAG: hypothetical protein B7Y07_02540 [Halothiobacillus sp. 24-54-40]OZA80652.1 MAG: hypothetical protein B7X64_05005 [Halothiobacillus sp. 39-53-45]